MNLSEKQFNKQTNIKMNGETGTVYTYETRDAIYDVFVAGDGNRIEDVSVQKNLGGYKKHVEAWEPIHFKIAEHFGLKKPKLNYC